MWQPHTEDGAGSVFDPDAPAVGFDRELAEGEAQSPPRARLSRPVTLDLCELLENALA
jgi:hypothetical protein